MVACKECESAEVEVAQEQKGLPVEKQVSDVHCKTEEGGGRP